MTDLTKIKVPFGLLDPETQEALKAHDGPWEYWSHLDGWHTVLEEDGPTFTARDVWRVRPAPPQPRTIYLCEFRDGERSFHKTAIDATKAALSYGHGATVSEWREVLE